MSELESLQARKANILSELATMQSKPSYSIDGQWVDHTAYRRSLLEELRLLDELIARRVCADAVRSRRRRRLTLVREERDLELLAPAPGGDPTADGASVTDLLARLDADRREAFVLTQLLGLPYAEAAEVAGCPVGTIRSRVARARADLVDSLAGVTPGAQQSDARHT